MKISPGNLEQNVDAKSLIATKKASSSKNLGIPSVRSLHQIRYMLRMNSESNNEVASPRLAHEGSQPNKQEIIPVHNKIPSTPLTTTVLQPTFQMSRLIPQESERSQPKYPCVSASAIIPTTNSFQVASLLQPHQLPPGNWLNSVNNPPTRPETKLLKEPGSREGRFHETASHLENLEKEWNAFKEVHNSKSPISRGSSRQRTQRVQNDFTSATTSLMCHQIQSIQPAINNINTTTIIKKAVPYSKINLGTKSKDGSFNKLLDSSQDSERSQSLPREQQHFKKISAKYSNIYRKTATPPTNHILTTSMSGTIFILSLLTCLQLFLPFLRL